MDEGAGGGGFAPKLTKMETKAEISARVAREISDTEVARRNAKTARLRQARLEMEAELNAKATSPKPRRTKASIKSAT